MISCSMFHLPKSRPLASRLEVALAVAAAVGAATAFATIATTGASICITFDPNSPPSEGPPLVGCR